MNANSVPLQRSSKRRVFRGAFRLVAALVLLAGAASPSHGAKILSPVSKLCLQLTEETQTPEMKPCKDIPHQEWVFEVSPDDGKKYIMSLQRFKCLKATNPVTLEECATTGNAQRWVLDATTRRFSSASDSTKCLEVEDGSEGAELLLSTCTTSDSQKWYFECITNGERWYDNGTVYLVDRGLLRHVPGEAFASGGIFASWFRVRDVADGCPDSTSFGPYLTGTALPSTAELIRQTGTAAVYLLEGSTKRHVTDTEVMSKYKFDWSKVHDKTSTQMNSYATGDPIE